MPGERDGPEGFDRTDRSDEAVDAETGSEFDARETGAAPDGGAAGGGRTDGGTDLGSGWTQRAEQRRQFDIDDGDEVPLPDHELGQFFPVDPDLSGAERDHLRAEYGWTRAFFKTRPERYHDLQRWLNQARMGVSYDVYLTRATWYSLAAGLVGLLLGTLLALYLSVAGVLAGLSSPFLVGGGLLPVAEFLSANKVLLGGGAIAVLAGGLFAGGAWVGLYNYPRLLVDSRRRSIAYNLPHAIVFMYALSRGGVNLVEIVKRVSETGDTYGDVADEFDMVVRDVELFGNDLYTALRNARNTTASEGLQQFFEDMISVLESGGDPTPFFEEQSRTYLRRAEEEQETFLENLSVMSEVFIAAFVAAPLFAVVILIVIGVLGGDAVPQLYLLIYALMPLGMAGYLVLISTLSSPYVTPKSDLQRARSAESDAEPPTDDEAYAAYRRQQRRIRLRESLQNPFDVLRERPPLTLALTLPLAVLVVAAGLGTGLVPTTADAFIATPVTSTLWLAVVPFFVVTVPLAYFHERKRSRDREIVRRFPDTLNILSSANSMGIALPDALDIVSRWSGGRFGEELRAVRNDIRWNSNPADALVGLAQRLRIPQASRTIKLVAEGSRTTDDLSGVLSIAAEDTRNRFKMLRDRKNAMTAYIAVVVIGYLVYLLVIVLLDVSYLQPITDLPETPETPGGVASPVELSALPIAQFRMLFFHSVLIQGIGSGLLAGELADNDALSGLKYSIGLVAIATTVFVVI